MANYAYIALDGHGKESRGNLQVLDQQEALLRLKAMGYFPTRVTVADPAEVTAKRTGQKATARGWGWGRLGLGGRVKTKVLTEFTRQLATVVDSGIPLVRGLRLLEEQEEDRALKRIIGELAESIEGGCTFSEALARHPKTFNRLYENMVRVGEMGGVL